ncbi:Protein of unknown function [Pseudoalteromonas denitrificans DSM 6059]|uniref:Tll0287-like domain-containing protein n=2 Tax=Pseudoalteromonas TaxID=53246 RepID=A0A1I1ERV8_9GAMM|nr:Protein of unknown function [Pseudoalteromonas denitrificans DSM 6059]
MFINFSNTYASDHQGSINADKSLLISEIAEIYQASMTYIFKNQTLINQKGSDKSGLFGKSFLLNIKKAYRTKFNKPFPSDEHILVKALLRVMIEVMESNRTLFYDDDIQFKGFIPAIFAFQLSEKLSKKGLGLKIKFTSTPDMIRNQLNHPDLWEVETMKKIQESALPRYYDDKAKYLNKTAQRYFLPVKMQTFCLYCHGKPENNPLNKNRNKLQWTNIDKTGFPMENWTLKDFGGGISIIIYDK